MPYNVSCTIYIDGSCLGNPGPGGYGICLSRASEIILVSGYGGEYTTNNRMELTAAIEAIKLLNKSNEACEIYTDSEYVRKGITQWIPKWVSLNWKKTNNSDIENLDLWKLLYEQIRCTNISWLRVQAHKGNSGNDMVDTLAKAGAAGITDFSRYEL